MKEREKTTAYASKEFSRFAKTYGHYNIIQSEVARALVSRLPQKHFETVIDIGAGSGKVYESLLERQITFEHFIALDSSAQMLEIHPNGNGVKKVCADFNTEETFKCLSAQKDTLILSSSALQWSQDLDFTLKQIAQLSSQAYFAIFTSNTFKTLHRIAGIDSPIYSAEVLNQTLQKYYDIVSSQIQHYTLHFGSVHEMFRYIKKSGVSGGEKKLGYKETKMLMKNYPLDYLEFEVLFVQAERLYT